MAWGGEGVQVPFPAGWVLAAALLGRRARIQDRLDALAQTGRGFRLGRPQGLEDVQDVGGLEMVDTLVPDVGKRIGGQRIRPLVGVLRIRPTLAMGFDVVESRGLEGRDAGSNRLRGLPVADGIEARSEQLAGGEGAFAGLCQADGVDGAKAHVTRLRTHPTAGARGRATRISEDPRTGAGRGDLQVEPATIGMHAGRRGGHETGAELVDEDAGHPALLYP